MKETTALSTAEIAHRRQYSEQGSACSIAFQKQLGELLKTEREKHGLSHQDVAMQIHAHTWKVEKAEHGKTSLNWYVISGLLQLYGKELKISLEEKNSPNKQIFKQP